MLMFFRFSSMRSCLAFWIIYLIVMKRMLLFCPSREVLRWSYWNGSGLTVVTTVPLYELLFIDLPTFCALYSSKKNWLLLSLL